MKNLRFISKIKCSCSPSFNIAIINSTNCLILSLFATYSFMSFRNSIIKYSWIKWNASIEILFNANQWALRFIIICQVYWSKISQFYFIWKVNLLHFHAVDSHDPCTVWTYIKYHSLQWADQTLLIWNQLMSK